MQTVPSTVRPFSVFTERPDDLTPTRLRVPLSERDSSDCPYLFVYGADMRGGSQAYFWTPRWQRGEQEAQADIYAGRMKRFKTASELIAELND
jgi:hypothetical protein